MKTIDRLFCLLAVLPILFLAACNGGEPGPVPAKTAAATVEAAPAPQALLVVPVAEVAPPAQAPLVVSPQVDSIPAAAAAPVSPNPARDFRAEAAKYIGYYNSYRLTPEQEDVKETALSRMPAPCCDDNTMATCCCLCNMAKAVWGMSAHLIVDEGYDADRLEKTVRGWLADANPKGWSGRACYTGGCSNSFHQDGCGGMVEGYVF